MSKQTLSYKGYNGTVEISLEDNCLHGEVLFINDLIIYEGENPQELEANFQSVVDYYLEECKELNVDPDKPYSGTFNVRVGPDLHKFASVYAFKLGMNLNALVRNAIKDYIDENREVHIHKHTNHYNFSEFGNIETHTKAQYKNVPSMERSVKKPDLRVVRAEAH